MDLLGHVDSFVVIRGKVIEGVGSYLAIAVGEKSLKGRIMMGSSFVSPFVFVLFSDKTMA